MRVWAGRVDLGPPPVDSAWFWAGFLRYDGRAYGIGLIAGDFHAILHWRPF